MSWTLAGVSRDGLLQPMFSLEEGNKDSRHSAARTLLQAAARNLCLNPRHSSAAGSSEYPGLVTGSFLNIFGHSKVDMCSLTSATTTSVMRGTDLTSGTCN
eukprot:1158955-Pelagomonas_calceolata.AAC.20